MQDNKTIEYYNQNAKEFIRGTVNADMHEHAGRFLAAVGENPARKKILDFGCGSGRDSKYFIEKGYIVTDKLKEVFINLSPFYKEKKNHP